MAVPFYLIGILLNIWVPFIFKLNDDQSCDINQNYTKEYFYINLSYIVVVLVVPMILIFTCNLLTIMKIKKNEIERKKLQEIKKKSVETRLSEIRNKDHYKAMKQRTKDYYIDEINKISKTFNFFFLNFS